MSVVPVLPVSLGMEFRWKVRSVSEKSNTVPNTTRKKFKAIRYLELNKHIRISQADKSNLHHSVGLI
jgi:hypothetical protein